jgi:hypothetical protein
MKRFPAIAFDCAVLLALIGVIVLGLDWGLK